MTDEFAARPGEPIEAGRLLFELGWVPVTSGNLSARLADETMAVAVAVAVAVSGRRKGRLGPEAILKPEKGS
jgi:ribulose-5-phosphate 4-epimerase/fuculose-1-phosphate aldolase